MSPRRIGVLCLLLWSGVWAAPATGDRDLRLVTAMLEASGVEDPSRRAAYEDAMGRVVDQARSEIGDGRPTYRRARRLHRLVHARYLLKYRDDADGIDAILDSGEFNCVSGSLFFGVVAHTLGFTVEIAEGTRHLLLRLRFEGREVMVESTSPAGFDVLRGMGRSRWPAVAYGVARLPEAPSAAPMGVYGAYTAALEGVDLETAVAYIWHNRGQRALARGEPLQAAESFLVEHRLHPDLAARSDVLAGALAQAFRHEYDGGRFASAQRVAEIDLAIYPGRTTGRDRLLAAVLKRILAACAAGDPEAAEALLDAVGEADVTPQDLARLEREASREIAAEAVRIGQWERAVRMADRHAGAERDPVEAHRLRSWVQQRREGHVDHDSPNIPPSW